MFYKLGVLKRICMALAQSQAVLKSHLLGSLLHWSLMPVL
jgi:hypothetical protein